MRLRGSAKLQNLLAPLACVLTLLIPIIVWLISVGDPQPYFTHQAPPGQALYVISKLLGLLALALIWVQLMAALARFAPVLRGVAQPGRRTHVLLGLAAFGCVIAHLALFIAASTMRTNHLALALLLPKFDSGYYSSLVSVGVMAFWLLCVVMLAGWRRMRGYARWRMPHYAAAGAFALAFVHGFSVGSETGFGPMAYVYAFFAFSLLAAVISWIQLAAGRRRASELRLGSPAVMRVDVQRLE